MDSINLRTGDILHCSGKRLVSKLIKKFTKSIYSHTALFIRIDENPYIIDAQKDGVNLRPFDEWVKEFNYQFKVHRFPFNFNEEEFLKKALSKSGNTPYDFKGLLIKGPIKLLTGKWKDKGEKELEKMYCSEYVAWCFNWKISYRMNPEDVHRVCNNLGFIEIK